MTTATMTPAEAWPAASYILEEMNARSWSVPDLANAMGCDPAFVQNILDGARLTAIDAERLAKAFGTSSDLWLNLDRAFWKSLESCLPLDPSAHA